VLAAHSPGLTVDVVLADRSAACGPAGGAVTGLEKAAGLLGGRLVLADVAVADGTPRHDPLLLGRAYAEIFGEFQVAASPGQYGDGFHQHKGGDAGGDDRSGEG
jgi:hypothetical protein